MINRLNYTAPINMRGKMIFKASEHPLTDEALKYAESKEVKGIIEIVVRKDVPWKKIDDKISELDITSLTQKDKKALQQFLKAQNEWQVSKNDGAHKSLADYFKCRLQNS